MKSKKSINTVQMQKDEYLEKSFNTYKDLAKHAVDWTLFCPYSLEQTSFSGVVKILSLPSMQIMYSEMEGSIMFDLVVPEDCITFSVMKYIANKASVDEIKLSTNMIAVINDKQKYNFMHKGYVAIFDVSVNKNADPLLLEALSKAVNYYFIDTNKNILTILEHFINRFSNKNFLEHEVSMNIEHEITKAMLRLTYEQEKNIPHFTKSERIAIRIKKQLFLHMDANVSISSLAKEYNISERSLQNSFRSLYDITPVQFIRLLKLNHVHHELIEKNAKDSSVIRTAQKWGFKHMGKFSQHYKVLFGQNPSTTLKSSNQMINDMHKECVQRQEEMT